MLSVWRHFFPTRQLLDDVSEIVTHHLALLGGEPLLEEPPLSAKRSPPKKMTRVRGYHVGNDPQGLTRQVNELIWM